MAKANEAAVENETQAEPEAPEATADSSTDEAAPQKPAKTVPLEEHTALRKRAQEAEARAEKLRIENEVIRRQGQSVLPRTEEPEPELTDDDIWKGGGPAKYINETRARAKKDIAAAAAKAAFEARAALSEDAAEERWPDYLEKRAYWFDHATVADRQQMEQERNPAKFVYNWAKNRIDPPKSKDEEKAALKAEILAELKESGVEIPAQEEKPKKPILKSIAGNRNAKGDTVQVRNLTAIEGARKALHGKF
jgi:hypothetical protein